MAAVNAQLEVVSRAGDPTQHLVENDYTQTFQLSTTDSGYTSATGAFATTVYNYYNSELSAANVSNVEIRWTVWLGGSAVSGGQTTNQGVIGTIASATDLQNELNSHIAHVISGDQSQSGL